MLFWTFINVSQIFIPQGFKAIFRWYINLAFYLYKPVWQGDLTNIKQVSPFNPRIVTAAGFTLSNGHFWLPYFDLNLDPIPSIFTVLTTFYKILNLLYSVDEVMLRKVR